jgi:two-component system alkaline phosphatase synthesis response regulator PhoP
MTRVLIVEDEPTIAFALEADLTSEGYAATVVRDGREVAAAVGREQPDLILLDIMMPGRDGFEVCRDLRRAGVTTPIIVLTARAHDAEKVMGLELGADDYVTKPYNPRELRARVKAVLRRTNGAGQTAEPRRDDVIRFGDVEADFGRGEVRRSGRRVELSALEYKLLSAFVRNRGRLLSREQLLDAAWGHGVVLNDRVVDNHIVGLRRKLEADSTKPKFFLNVRGLGYRFDA